MNNNFELNVKELEKRGYQKSINQFLNEDEWIKGNVSISIHSIRGCTHQYFNTFLNQKEQFNFEVI